MYFGQKNSFENGRLFHSAIHGTAVEALEIADWNGLN